MSAIAAALSKPAIGWVGAILSKWLENNFSRSQNEKKTWTQIATRIAAQTKSMAARYMKVTTVAFPKFPVPLLNIYIPLTVLGQGNESFLIEDFPDNLFDGDGTAC